MKSELFKFKNAGSILELSIDDCMLSIEVMHQTKTTITVEVNFTVEHSVRFQANRTAAACYAALRTGLRLWHAAETELRNAYAGNRTIIWLLEPYNDDAAYSRRVRLFESLGFEFIEEDTMILKTRF